MLWLCAGCSTRSNNTYVTGGGYFVTDRYLIWYPNGTSSTHSDYDGFTSASYEVMQWVPISGEDDCAALCANFAFTNFSSPTCYKAVFFGVLYSCHLFLWDVVTKAAPDYWKMVVLSDCASSHLSVCRGPAMIEVC